jgi:phosphoenolpyruvate carboxykinase (ATP)
MHWLLPPKGVLSMHCAANEGKSGDVSLFFGLSGTGKTTLSADPTRRLLGDDEHGWSDNGVFNIEGGCYAKCIGLALNKEPDIYRAIRFGTVLENVVYDETTREVNFNSNAITENTRAAYPLEFIKNTRMPSLGCHPNHVIFLTCDASGVLPPVSRLTPEQAMYQFLSGYTARVAGTEMGVFQPQLAFSPCYSAAFLVRHPVVYARLLSEKIRCHGAQAWLVNTGWTGGGLGVGRRIDLSSTRRIIDAIHAGSLTSEQTQRDPVFGLEAICRVPGVSERLLLPQNAWSDATAWEEAARTLAEKFRENFVLFGDEANEAVVRAGPC